MRLDLAMTVSISIGLFAALLHLGVVIGYDTNQVNGHSKPRFETWFLSIH